MVACQVGPTLVTTPNLQAFRVRSGLIQRVLAERAHVDRRTISRLELGGRTRLDTVLKLAGALSVEPAELLGE